MEKKKIQEIGIKVVSEMFGNPIKVLVFPYVGKP